ncbi:unnamed protein product, partial [Lepidochelys olivacea]
IQTSKEHYRDGDVIIITCNHGFHIHNGQNTAECTKNSWLPPSRCSSKLHLCLVLLKKCQNPTRYTKHIRLKMYLLTSYSSLSRVPVGYRCGDLHEKPPKLIFTSLGQNFPKVQNIPPFVLGLAATTTKLILVTGEELMKICVEQLIDHFGKQKKKECSNRDENQPGECTVKVSADQK